MMCKGCGVVWGVDRGTLCLDTGCHVANFAGCKGCGKREMPKTVNKVRVCALAFGGE